MMAVGIASQNHRVLTLRHSQLLGLDFAPGQERRACHRTALRAVTVVGDYELVRDFVSDSSTGAAPSQHGRTLERSLGSASISTKALQRGASGRVAPEALPDPMRPARLLHRDRFVDVDRATDLEDRAALGELDRRIEAVGRHDGVAGQATRAAVAD